MVRCTQAAGLVFLLAWLAPVARGGEQLDVLSPPCRDALKSYVLCQARSDVFVACSATWFLNNTGVQSFLGCASASPDPAERLRICGHRCLQVAGAAANSTIDGPCPGEVQAMHSFSAPLDILFGALSNPALNISQPLLMPFPNVLGSYGLTSTYLGDPDKCARVSSAQYCVISGRLESAQPLPSPPQQTQQALQQPQEVRHLTQGPFLPGLAFYRGVCLPKTCSEGELGAALSELHGRVAEIGIQLHLQCSLVQPVASVGRTDGEAYEAMHKFLGWGVVPVEYPNRFSASIGFVVVAALCCLLLALLLLGTAADVRRTSKERLQHQGSSALELEERRDGALLATRRALAETAEPLAPRTGADTAPRRGAGESFLSHWSLARNCRSLLRVRPADMNPFACLDAIRVISMCQVICGHMFVYPMMSSGVSNLEQFFPPDGLLGSFWFMLVPGCFYGVDTFFLLSGFLCAHGLQTKVFSVLEWRSLRAFSGIYAKVILLRVLRLLPLEMFCIALVYNVLPMLGTGVLWNMDLPDGRHCFDFAGRDGCETYWWTNLIFVQNFDQYMGKCFQHAWYIAADMQLYLAAPVFGLAYGVSPAAGWSLLGAALVAGVVAPMAQMAHFRSVPDVLLSGTSGFLIETYVKPWSRIPPFAVGIAMAWLWLERLEKRAGRHTTKTGAIGSYAASFLGLALCAIPVFGRLAMFRGDILTCMGFDTNPAGKLFMYLWVGLSSLAWSVGVAIIAVLCFLGRFLPLLQDVLCHGLWQPFAKLTYAAYLIHTSVLILDFCQRTSMVTFVGASYVFSFLGIVVVTFLVSFCLYMLVEKPLANLQMKMLS